MSARTMTRSGAHSWPESLSSCRQLYTQDMTDTGIEAMRLGVTKVNYGNYLKQRCLEALRLSITSDRENPHELLGMGGEHDVMIASRLAVRDAVLERIELLGCCGKAN